MKKSNFDILMHRYLTGRVSEQERIKIEAWLNVMKTERTHDLELSKADEERLFEKITNSLDNADDVTALYARRHKLKSLMSNRWLQIAASILVVISISYATWTMMSGSDAGQIIASGAPEKIILNDGTLVWLQEGSKFSYYQKEEGVRHAELAGEALFEVAKKPNSPFTISCGNITVKVLGTSFNLRTNQESIELKVLTGKVSLSSTEDKTGVTVAPHEKVIYTTNGKIERIAMAIDDLSNIMNTEYNMQFSNATMDKVIGRIEKKFDIRVMVADDDLKKCRITADLTDNSLDSTLVVLTDMLDVTYRINKKTVELTGKGCN